jgi:PadR family transcriptional regulator, regulatory protein AphA
VSSVLRNALLALVSEKPRSGYDLARIFEQSLSYAWSAGHSQIYPELARLRADGLIEAGETGPRGRLVYRVTPEGRDAVRDWLLETEPNRASRNETLLRVFFLWLVTADDRRAFLERERAHHERMLLTYEELASRDAWSSPAGESGRLALEFGIRFERTMLDWIGWALARLDSS